MDAHHTGVAEGTWLAPWLSWLDAALEHEVARFRTRYGLEAGDLRALHLGDEQVDGLLAAPVHTDDPATATLDARLRRLLDSSIRAGDPLGRIAEQFELEPASIVAVVLALAPETDLAYAGVYAYLNDDATMRLATVDLCRRLTPGGGSLSSDAAVVTEGLVSVVGSVAAPLWSATGLVLSGPLRRFLLAGGAAMPSRPRARPAALPRLTLFEGEVDDDATAAAREHALMAGWCLVEPDPPGPAGNALSDAVLTARLHGAAVFVPAAYLAATADDVGSGHAADVVRSLLRAPVPLVLGIRPGWAHRLPLTGVDHEVVRVGRPDIADRTRLWWRELSAAGAAPPPEAVAEVAGLFALGPAQIRAAAVAVAREGAHDAAALLRAARAAGGAGLGAIAERVDAEPTWDDLVLPEATLRRLRELADAVRSRHRVFDSWGFGRATAGRSGVRVLLSGPSGTGKTMAASVLAHDLGLELYRIDLSAVVSKYIGETEKNLERVLSAAERSNALLLFDEADALFGKRSEVSDSHDRYANIEIAFLLQRIEAFDGVLLLATNLPGNLDDAFARRMQFHLEFPLPDRVARERLWRQAIPAAAPRADDLDPAFLAGMFPLAGGDIRSASVQAAFLAAHDDEPIGMRHLVRAVARLRRQHGKLPSAAEFKEYVKYAREDDG